MITPRAPRGDAEKEKQTMKMVPMPWRGGVDDIANALVFFLSNLSKYVTGQTLAVDGGLTSVGPLDYSRFATMKGEVRGQGI